MLLLEVCICVSAEEFNDMFFVLSISFFFNFIIYRFYYYCKAFLFGVCIYVGIEELHYNIFFIISNFCLSISTSHCLDDVEFQG